MLNVGFDENCPQIPILMGNGPKFPLQRLQPFLTQGFSELPHIPEGSFERPQTSPRQGAADQDAAQGILLPSHRHGWADIQVAKGVKAGDVFPGGLAGHIAKIRALGKRGAVIGTPPGGEFWGKKRGLAIQ